MIRKLDNRGGEHLFWKNAEQVGDCWLWRGNVGENGYGKYGKAGLPAHRKAYVLAFGLILSHMHIDHTCRNRTCVNPHHLEEVTPKENTKRMNIALGIGIAKTHCVNGHPFNETNTYRRRDGVRNCRLCATIRARNKRNQLQGVFA